uniref:Fructose-bisphosphate aldolase n=1 Tax=Hemiselmis andersenii TaxID=464988 RepID=A0A6U5AYN2_HEMAN|mmetsp:Transcript_50303/g.122047  ORF Transcript_50303/g.122047 Transcript_50303/m.122047 type:complete len:280 (+) Transcript_50303:34-873(+)
MSIIEKLPRAARLFNPKDKRLLNVAVDHGVFNEDRFLPGIEDMQKVMKTLVEAQPDVIQVTLGQARTLFTAGTESGQRLPALVVRTDVANVYGTSAPPLPFCNLQHPQVVDEAVRLDACAVICNLLLLPKDAPGAGEVHQTCIKNVSTLRAECTKVGMPLIVEPLAFRWNNDEDKTAFAMETSIRVTRPLVRLACELGADIIKCDPPADPAEFQSLVSVCKPCPVLLRGGEKGEESAVMAAAKALLDAGAAGLVYGRNIIHHNDPSYITRKFMDVVHTP